MGRKDGLAVCVRRAHGERERSAMEPRLADTRIFFSKLSRGGEHCS